MTIARRGFLALGAAAACAAPPGLAAAAVDVLALKVEYEATSLVGPGEDPPRGRLWRTPTALRHEGGAGGSQVLVARLDRNVGWLGLPELGMAIQTDLDALDLPLDVPGEYRMIINVGARHTATSTLTVHATQQPALPAQQPGMVS